MIRKAIGYLGIGIVAAVLIASLPAHFYGRAGPNGTYLDGYGRQVAQPPEFLRPFMDRWRGLGWYAFDIVAFWGSLAVGASLISFGFNTNKRRRSTNTFDPIPQRVQPIFRSPSLESLAEASQRLETQPRPEQIEQSRSSPEPLPENSPHTRQGPPSASSNLTQTMTPLSDSIERALHPYANALVHAMMRSYSLGALFSGNLLVPFGPLRQPLGPNHFVEGHLHRVVEKGPWHRTTVTFRLNIASSGTVLKRTTIANIWFDYAIFSRELSNFTASELNEPELLRLTNEHSTFEWTFGKDFRDLRY